MKTFREYLSEAKVKEEINEGKINIKDVAQNLKDLDVEWDSFNKELPKAIYLWTKETDKNFDIDEIAEMLDIAEEDVSEYIKFLLSKYKEIAELMVTKNKDIENFISSLKKQIREVKYLDDRVVIFINDAFRLGIKSDELKYLGKLKYKISDSVIENVLLISIEI